MCMLEMRGDLSCSRFDEGEEFLMRVSNLRSELTDFVWDAFSVEVGVTLEVDDAIEILNAIRDNYVTLLFMNEMGNREFERKMDLSKELLDELNSGTFTYLEFT